MCEFLIFNTQRRYERQKNFGNFSATFWKFSNFSATFWQRLDTFIGNFFGIHRQLVAKPSQNLWGPPSPCKQALSKTISLYRRLFSRPSTVPLCF